jgi:hypothetical protein
MGVLQSTALRENIATEGRETGENCLMRSFMMFVIRAVQSFGTGGGGGLQGEHK